MDHSLIHETESGLGAMDHWIVSSFFGTEVCLKGWIDGSMDHSLIHETEIGLGAMDHWIVSFFLEQRYV